MLDKEIKSLNSISSEKEYRELILDLVKDYSTRFHNQPTKFVPGSTRVNYAGRVYDENELVNLVDSSLDFWLTSGRYTDRFERDLGKYLGRNFVSLVNSGSSANLLAFRALTSSTLKDRRINKGDEVITVAAGFPTTVAPVLDYGAVPVFIDIDVEGGTYNIDVKYLEEALSPKTKAVFIAHTLGNPFDLETITEFCKKNNLWLIEDNCDALGSKYNGKSTGTFGDLATSSFYPPHHITMGEGGAVYTNKAKLKRLVDSYRDWGRDCWCPSGKDNTCEKRFDWELGELPKGYDHKYIYSHLGFNLKATDMQAAIGCAQIEKLDSFTQARRKNWTFLREELSELSEHFILPNPTKNAEPSWFGFLLTVRDNAPFSRTEITKHLESKNIQTRMLFAGNLLRHPVFDEYRGTNAYRVIGDLKETDRVMNNTFWVGVYPGMTEEKLSFISDSLKSI